MATIASAVCLAANAAPGAGAGAVVSHSRTQFPTPVDVVVDSANEHVFVSGGGGSTSIGVHNLSTNPIGEIQGEYGVDQMVLMDGRLYALAVDTGEIDVINAGTLALERSFEVGPLLHPGFLAPAAGRLWTGVGDCTERGGDVVGIDPETGGVAGIPHAAAYCSAVVSPGPDSKWVVAYNLYLDRRSSTLTRWNVSRFQPRAVVSRRLARAPVDISFSADGRLTYVLTNFELDVYDSSNFTPLWSLRLPPRTQPVGIVESPDGATVSVGLYSSQRTSDPDVATYPIGGSRVIDILDLGGTPGRPATKTLLGTLAFGPQGELFLAGDYSEPTDEDQPEAVAHLYKAVISSTDPARRTQISLSVAHISGHRYGVHCESAGTLAGRRVRLFRTTWERTRPERVVDLDADGRCYAVVRMRQTGSLYAEFAGDRELVASRSDPVSIFVRPVVTAQLLDGFGKHGRYLRYAAGIRPLVRGSVQPVQHHASVRFRVQGRLHRRWVDGDVESFRMNSRGEAFATLKGAKSRVPYRTRTEFRWRGQTIRSPWRYFELGPFHTPDRATGGRSLTASRGLGTLLATERH